MVKIVILNTCFYRCLTVSNSHWSWLMSLNVILPFTLKAVYEYVKRM